MSIVFYFVFLRRRQKDKRKKPIIIFSILMVILFLFKYDCYYEEISKADRIVINNYLSTFQELTIKQPCQNDPIRLFKLEKPDEKEYVKKIFLEALNKPSLNYGDLQFMSYKIQQYRREKVN